MCGPRPPGHERDTAPRAPQTPIQPRAHVSWYERTYPRTITAPHYARGFVQLSLLLWGVPDLIGDAETIVSELVTNAVVHASGPNVGVRLENSGTSVCIRVWDEAADRMPRIQAFDLGAVSGWGLQVVATLADSVDMYRADTGGKVVAATLLTGRPVIL